MSAAVKKNHIKFNGMKYFRGNAHQISLGGVGAKKAPIGGVNRLEQKDQIASRHLDDIIKKGTVIDIDWVSSKSVDFKGKAPVKAFKLGGGFSNKVKHKGDIKLANFSIRANDLERCLNNKAHIIREYLDEEGRDGRVVSEIFVVMEAELANAWDRSGSANFSAKKSGADIELELNIGSKGKQTIVISEDTTFAYGLQKVKKWKKGVIKDLESDYYGGN